jgi:hypothetical protein
MDTWGWAEWVFAVALIGVGMACFLGLVVSPAPVPGSHHPDLGEWVEVGIPPASPEGTKCWVWRSGYGTNAVGGLYCFEETP